MTQVPHPALAELRVSDDPSVWTRLGFTLTDGVAQVGSVAIRPVGLGVPGRPGIVGWSFRDGRTTELDGLPTELVDGPPLPPGVHPNGATAVDHVVVSSYDRARTSDVFDAAGLGLRRIRSVDATPERGGREVVQAFHRAGDVIVEVVGEPEPTGDGPSAFWGLVVTVRDLDATVARIPEAFRGVKDAVQPGRHIATVVPKMGTTTQLAFMSA